jgi:amidophosphoribosyltransferase
LVGICSVDEINMPERLFYPLFALQHRGQESSGITYVREGLPVTYKDLGMVFHVLSHYLAERHPSRMGIGHVRYSTQGKNRLENAQPITVNCNKGWVSLVHNGTLSNSASLRRELFSEGSIFQTGTDSELILHLLSRSARRDFLDALHEVLPLLEGAFNLLMLREGFLVAVRDPHGFRPLVLGRREGMTVLASETCALDILRIGGRRQVEPGELIMLDAHGLRSERFAVCERKRQCIFELIYFARPDSVVFGRSVYATRERMGQFLADDDPRRGDVVVPVPDSGISAAVGYANRSGTPLRLGLTRNHYSGRTFIQPDPRDREFGVRMKLHPVEQVIRGRRITLIDDSLVRGTTAGIIVKLLRDAGAREIHLRLSAPEVRFPCHYGIDIPTEEELISNRMDPDEVARHIGADSVRFLSVQRLAQSVENPGSYCYACFGGHSSVQKEGGEHESQDIPAGRRGRAKR